MNWRPADSAGTDWLIGGGEMAKLIKSTDWSTTLLGPIDSWPQSLRTVVSLALASNWPISAAYVQDALQWLPSNPVAGSVEETCFLDSRGVPADSRTPSERAAITCSL